MIEEEEEKWGERNKISERGTKESGGGGRSIRENDSEIFKNECLIENKGHEYCVAFQHPRDR